MRRDRAVLTHARARRRVALVATLAVLAGCSSQSGDASRRRRSPSRRRRTRRSTASRRSCARSARRSPARSACTTSGDGVRSSSSGINMPDVRVRIVVPRRRQLHVAERLLGGPAVGAAGRDEPHELIPLFIDQPGRQRRTSLRSCRGVHDRRPGRRPGPQRRRLHAAIDVTRRRVRRRPTTASPAASFDAGAAVRSSDQPPPRVQRRRAARDTPWAFSPARRS